MQELDLAMHSVAYDAQQKMYRASQLLDVDVEQGLAILDRLCQKKYLPAMVRRAVFFRDTQKENDKALKLLAEAAEHYNHPAAYREWALTCMSDTPIDQVDEKTIRLLKKAADLGDARGQCCYAHILHAGPESTRDASLAEEYWQQACDQGLISVFFDYGLYLSSKEGCSDKGCAYIKKAASLGFKEAHFWLGVQYALDESSFVGQDLQKAFRSFVAAFTDDDARVHAAIFDLVKNGGFCLPQTTSDPGFAVIVDSLAAVGKKNPEAYYQLARMYDSGKMFKQSSQNAQLWYESAAKGGHAESCYYLGLSALSNGDRSQSADHFSKGAYLGSVGCMLHYGQMLLTGCGVSHHPAQAIAYLRKAKEGGSTKASEYLEQVGALYVKSLDNVSKEYDADGRALLAQMNAKKSKGQSLFTYEKKRLEEYKVIPYTHYAHKLDAIDNHESLSVLNQFKKALIAKKENLEKTITKNNRSVVNKRKKRSKKAVEADTHSRQIGEIDSALQVVDRSIANAQVLSPLYECMQASKAAACAEQEMDCITLFAQDKYDEAYALAATIAGQGSAIGFLVLGRLTLLGQGSTVRNVYAGIRLLSYGRDLVSQQEKPQLYEQITQILNNAGKLLCEYAQANSTIAEDVIVREICDGVMYTKGGSYHFSEDQRTFLLGSLYRHIFGLYKKVKEQADAQIQLLKIGNDNNYKKVSAQLAPLHRSLKILKENLPESTFDD